MKLCKQEAEILQNYENVHIRKAKPNTESIRGLSLAVVKRMTFKVTANVAYAN
jgi:hypothetical protein